jgi:poly(rC)-binding protein 3/4
VYRIPCPEATIGGVIGKNGNVINAILKHTNARVKVLDPNPSSQKRVIVVYCYVKHRNLGADESGDSEHVCAAQDALLRVHQAILGAQD